MIHKNVEQLFVLIQAMQVCITCDKDQCITFNTRKKLFLYTDIAKLKYALSYTNDLHC